MPRPAGTEVVPAQPRMELADCFSLVSVSVAARLVVVRQVLSLCLGLTGCQSPDPAPALPTAVEAVGSFPVGGAPHWVAGFRLVAPEQTYGAASPLFDRALPRSLALAAVASLGLDPRLSGRLVAGRDWLGVVIHGAQGSLGWALAIPVVSGRELVAELSLGSDARFSSHPRDAWVELSGAVTGGLGPLVLGVSRNFLLVGSVPFALDALALGLSRGAEAKDLAPTQTEPGMSLRVFASGVSLQALHAFWRETVDPWGSASAVAQATSAWARPSSEAFIDLLQGRVSAYLGLLNGGELHVRWSGRELGLDADFAAPRLQWDGDATVCREIQALPPNTRWWVAGVESPGRSEDGGPPDWDAPPGSWQRGVLETMVGATPFSDRLRIETVQPWRSAPWLFAWREQSEAATALAVLHGAPPINLKDRSFLGVSASGRVAAATEGGKVVEWAWAPRGGGSAIALGAPMGESWERWVKQAPSASWPSGVDPSECRRLLVAVGSDSKVLLAALRTPSGFALRGKWNASALGGATK